MLAGFNIKANFTMSGMFGIANSTGVYDDGYVLPDSLGAAADTARGETGNFGFNSANQINSSGNLVLHQATGFTVASGNSSGNNSPYIGFDMAYGDSYWYWEHAKIGWEFGFGLLPIWISGNAAVSVNQNTYTFNNAGGISLSVAQPPYQGGFNNAGDQLFVNNAAAGPPVNSTVPGTTGETLNVMMYTFRLGPTLYWNLSRDIGLYAGGGPAVGLVSGNLTANGIVTLADGTTAHYNAPSVNGTDFVYGGYVNATLVYHVVEGGDFYLGAEYMPMNGANFSGSGMTAHLDLSGQVYVTAGINWPF